MRYREVTVVAAVAEEVSVVKGGNSKLQFTNVALTNFAASPPAICPVMIGHGTAVEQRVGHVARWSLDGDTLTAIVRITDLEHPTPKVGDGVSLGIDFTSRLSESTGFKRITSFTVRELSLIENGGRGAMRSARVVEVGEVQGTHDDATELATRWKASGASWGASTVAGQITGVE